MDGVVITAASAVISIAVALVGVWAARKKGLPSINAEIESRNTKLIDTLRETVDALQQKVDAGAADFKACKSRLESALSDNDSLRRRVSLAEDDLLTLYRERGMRPPPRLQRGHREPE